MAFAEKFLGQVTPSTGVGLSAMTSFTTAVSGVEALATCGANERVVVRTVFVSNVSTSTAYVALWHDPVGTSYASGTTDGTIAIGNTVLVPPWYLTARKVLALDMYLVLDAQNSQLMCAASGADRVTFSAYGATVST